MLKLGKLTESEDMKKAFLALKRATTDNVLLAFTDYSKPFD